MSEKDDSLDIDSFLGDLEFYANNPKQYEEIENIYSLVDHKIVMVLIQKYFEHVTEKKGVPYQGNMNNADAIKIMKRLIASALLELSRVTMSMDGKNVHEDETGNEGESVEPHEAEFISLLHAISCLQALSAFVVFLNE